jgi:hypothetical protein
MSFKHKTYILLALAPFTVALGAHPLPARADEPPRARSETTTYAFEDELVQGGTVGPDGEVLHVRKRSERGSLIRVRTQYVAELLKSAETL